MTGTRAPSRRDRWSPPGGVFGRTYLLLRWAMPVLLLWLTVAIAYAWIKSGIRLPMTSISAYYYTDAQTVFVGVLIGLGVLLVVIQGRTPWEDAWMNTAGALAPFVALLPTPVAEDDRCIASYCTARFLKGQLPDNHEIIAFNVFSVVPIWLTLCLYLALRARTLYGEGGYERNSSLFSAAATILFGSVAILLWISETERQRFYDWAHLVSAASMVAMLIFSIVPFANWMGPESQGFFAGKPRFLSNAFWWILWGILFLILCWVIGLLVIPQWDHKVLVIEVIAIVPFALYWIVQGLALGKLDRPGAETAA